VEVTQAARNLHTVLAAAGRPDVPLGLGEAGPIGPAPDVGRPAWLVGRDGLGDAGLSRERSQSLPPALEVLDRAITRFRPHLVTLGPLSTVASCSRTIPHFFDRLSGVTSMAGAVRVGGNAQAAAEANVLRDPLAAAHMLAAAERVEPVLVPLDATLSATLGPAELEHLDRPTTPAARFLAQPLRHVRDALERVDIPVHDLLAMRSVIDPELISPAPLPLMVDVGGDVAWGATVADERGGNRNRWPVWQVALTADEARFRAAVVRLFTSRPEGG
jgi:purine nucleosidase